MRLRFDPLQRVGRALMLPIAVLPLAGLLLRLGQPDLLDLAFMAAAGNAVFAHLGLLFAAGVAVGLARENNGAAGVAGVVCFLVLTEGAKTFLVAPPGIAAGLPSQAWADAAIAKLSVPSGIAAGLVSGLLYNRFHTIRVPEYLAFFGGRRFVPIAAGAAGVVGAVALGLGLPAIEGGVDTVSRWALGSGPVGLFIYGALNRLLLVTGLHHIINNVAWFVLGDFGGATGDLKRFFAGDPTAGGFMSGFFPVMMFGLPAACLAMYRAAPPHRRGQVGGLLLSLALTSFLTGVTEPIEFTFLFLAPALYLFHALMTGLAMVVMDALGVKLGFTFSAGLADYLVNFGLDQRPLLLLPVGLVYALVYYTVFSFVIRRFDLATPGRESGAQLVEERPAETGGRGLAFLEALGGKENVVEVDACTTRLRLTLMTPAKADEAGLRSLGARGVLRPGGGAVQVVLGPMADIVAGEIREAMGGGRAPFVAAHVAAEEGLAREDVLAIIAAFGGASNVTEHLVRGNRVIVSVRDAPAKPPTIALAGLRGVVRAAPNSFHVIMKSRR
ncbi:N-acetylglucosamine-specific PTS transporter subunit IIBC [Novosphingobium sp. PS1R-30]|uniref:N-acetylglucosamine-specific PTS transporter subunit IIBC n=1 Tax=Novosphingobium anseongense TaxID=3133436 RepID=A0ABU8S1K3_9SPHN